MPEGKILANIIKTMKKGDADPISPLIDRYLIERERPENRHKRITEWNISLKPNVRPLGRISPSAVGSCERLAVFKFVGMEGAQKRVNPDTELIFEDGHWRHHKWQAIFTEMESILGSKTIECVAIERPVRYKKLYIAGALDAELRIADRDEMVPWVIDVKGINKYGYADVYAKQEPKEAHVLQLLSYMKARRIRNGVLLYDCKDDQRYMVFTIKFSTRQWAKVVDWCESVMYHLEYQRLPPMHPDCNHGNMLYEKCPFRKYCYGRFASEKLERMAFRDFPGIEPLWQEGLRLEQEG